MDKTSQENATYLSKKFKKLIIVLIIKKGNQKIINLDLLLVYLVKTFNKFMFVSFLLINRFQLVKKIRPTCNSEFPKMSDNDSS